MTIGHPRQAPDNQRPHQWGLAKGLDEVGDIIEADVEWLVDTGADVGVMQQQVGELFQSTTIEGLSASPTIGEGAIEMVTGIEVGIEVEDPGGATETRWTTRPVGIKSTNEGSNIVGMDQLAEVDAAVEWDPLRQQGRLHG
jgi:hypothetical protein